MQNYYTGETPEKLSRVPEEPSGPVPDPSEEIHHDSSLALLTFPCKLLVQKPSKQISSSFLPSSYRIPSEPFPFLFE